MFAALPEEEKGALHATCFAPLLLIDPITTMSTLVVEIFDRHLGDMKFQFGETIIQMKPIHVCLILVLHVSPVANKRCSSIKFVKNYTIISPPEQGEKRLGERNQIEAPAIGALAVGAPAIGNSSSATEIRATVVRVCSQLEEHGKILHNHGKMLEGILMFIVEYSTLPLGDTPLFGQYQFFTPEKTSKRNREGDNMKDDEKRKKAELRTWQQKN
ncbi:hypothetical protein GIB67_002330 [Kingdonia uniflora]|uniref:Uncharacterized protein n=1 Tax=Kingdonia uniflora TaxID=39325 RepID=A0A7J7KX22_9MAGN|nr:hypothetical protein GIB67_002330 [Kingdonia uniflora]